MPSVRDMIQSTMADLPTSPTQGNKPINTNNPITQSTAGDDQAAIGQVPQARVYVASTSKEKEGIGLGSSELPLTAVGMEGELPKEVIGAGVKVQPTSLSVPPVVQKMGVQPVGGQPATVSSSAVALPLTNDQIAQGLHQSITTSWRWLAEWCVRKLKQLHRVLKSVGRKIV